MYENEIWEEDDFSHSFRMYELYLAEKLYQKMKG